MLKKQNIWFVVLFSLILVLGIYYITMPSDVLEQMTIQTKEGEKNVESVEELSSLTALRVSKEASRKEKMESLETSLTSDNLSTEEKNNTFELLKYLNQIQGTEEKQEKKLKKELGLDCYTKNENQEITAICVSKEHNPSLANKVMRILQEFHKEKMNISVKFQNQ